MKTALTIEGANALAALLPSDVLLREIFRRLGQHKAPRIARKTGSLRSYQVASPAEIMEGAEEGEEEEEEGEEKRGRRGRRFGKKLRAKYPRTCQNPECKRAFKAKQRRTKYCSKACADQVAHAK